MHKYTFKLSTINSVRISLSSTVSVVILMQVALPKLNMKVIKFGFPILLLVGIVVAADDPNDSYGYFYIKLSFRS